MNEKPLKPIEIRFVNEYLIDRNAAAAYKRAGYKGKGGRVSAHRLLTNANIKKTIENAEREREVETKTTAADVINKYADFAFNADFQKKRKVKNGEILKALDGLSRIMGLNKNGIPNDKEDPLNVHITMEYLKNMIADMPK